MIEVKTAMDRLDSLRDAVENIASAKETESISALVGLIFAFNGLQAQTVLEELTKLQGGV